MPNEPDDLATGHHHRANRGKAVTLELFFDLVFVSAFTQVTAFLAKDSPGPGLVAGLPCSPCSGGRGSDTHGWLPQSIPKGWIRLAFFAAMAMMFVVALATSDPFGKFAVVFDGGYLGVPLCLGVVGVRVVCITATFWWLYFDVIAIAAERKLHELSGQARNSMARDSYFYLHLLLVTGVVLVVLGCKKTAADPTKTLAIIPVSARAIGAGLYLLTLSTLRRRNYGSFNVARLITAPVRRRHLLARRPSRVGDRWVGGAVRPQRSARGLRVAPQRRRKTRDTPPRRRPRLIGYPQTDPVTDPVTDPATDPATDPGADEYAGEL